MRVAISFSNFLKDVAEGAVDPKQIEAFYFGCKEEHVIGSDGLVPFEVTWLNKTLKHHHGESGNRVAMEHIEDRALDAWVKVRERILDLMQVDRVHWAAVVKGESNYWKMAKALMAEGHQVWMRGDWVTDRDLQYA